MPQVPGHDTLVTRFPCDGTSNLRAKSDIVALFSNCVFTCGSHGHQPPTPTAVPGYAAVCRAVLYGCRGRKAHLRAIFDVVSFAKAKVTQVVGRRPFAGSARLRGQGQVGEMVRQGAQAIYDVVEGPIRRGALEVVVQRLMKEGEEKKITEWF